jgi:hypothetical protein
MVLVHCIIRNFRVNWYRCRTFVVVVLFLLMMCWFEETHILALSTVTKTTASTKYYKYFAIGSNMVPSTMTSLRNLSPISATAAILPNYELRFNIPGNPFIEPSAASVQKLKTIATDDTNPQESCVHGVLYTLTEDDFAKLGRSEGVPFAYVWERCYPIPYIGNNENAGHEALLLHHQQQVTALDEAFVLTANTLFTSNTNRNDIPPSQSYLQILQDGSKYWKMDMKYQMYLQNEIPTNSMVPGISKLLLQVAESKAKTFGTINNIHSCRTLPHL